MSSTSSIAGFNLFQMEHGMCFFLSKNEESHQHETRAIISFGALSCALRTELAYLLFVAWHSPGTIDMESTGRSDLFAGPPRASAPAPGPRRAVPGSRVSRA